jgi:hypothetical protein
MEMCQPIFQRVVSGTYAHRKALQLMTLSGNQKTANWLSQMADDSTDSVDWHVQSHSPDGWDDFLPDPRSD